MEPLSPNAELAIIRCQQLIKNNPKALERWVAQLVQERDRAVEYADQVSLQIERIERLYQDSMQNVRHVRSIAKDFRAQKSVELPNFYQSLNKEAKQNDGESCS